VECAKVQAFKHSSSAMQLYNLCAPHALEWVRLSNLACLATVRVLFINKPRKQLQSLKVLTRELTSACPKKVIFH
jgi:hypothetical protein